MNYVKHPLIVENSIESRAYQEAILGTAAKNHTLCVLPTGLGKTNIAIMLAAHRLEKYPDSRIIVMAPTRPLVNQHYKTFVRSLKIPVEDMVAVTGFIKPEERERLYGKKLLFATPQVIENDLKSGILSLERVSLLVIDEAHHSVGGYAYPFVAKTYLEQARFPRILALTASPGGTTEKIQEIKNNLGINAVEIRTDEDHDVRPWIKEKQIDWIYVELPESFLRIKRYLDEAIEDRAGKLKSMGFLKKHKPSKRDFLELQAKMQASISRGHKAAFGISSIVAQVIKLEHALDLLETQGITMLEKYWKRLKEDTTKAAKTILKDQRVANAMFLSRELFESGSKHPKMGKLCQIVDRQFREKDSKIIIFANYRESVKEIVSSLKNIEGVRPVEFVGQKEGLTQKEQIARLSDFRDGVYNVLVGTSVSEEGLDIPAMDLAIFYEPVPSEIRSIQRRGRVGRQKVGRVIFLITRRTRDEAYFWSAHNKEKRMHKTLYGMKSAKPTSSQTSE
ncbi:MAG: DEAD/DEAH box helicase [Candidatus Aenigmarchaeota archaeon]|nr:DEAD/DEAH box helicase [Candidatus Aenigmarchaeota archaeon]